MDKIAKLKYDYCKLTWPHPYLMLVNYAYFKTGPNTVPIKLRSEVYILQYRPDEGVWRQ